jgi:hypothetical protein
MDDFTFRIVDEKTALGEVFAFRYNILMEIYPEYIQQANLSENLEYDKYDSFAHQLAIYDANKKLCATVRLINNSPIGYPTENSLEFDNSEFQRKHLGEMSRIFVAKEYRNFKTTKAIIEGVKQTFYWKMKELGIRYTYGSLEKNFLRLLHIYKMRYEPLVKAQEHRLFGLRYPCVLYTEKLGRDNHYEN